MRFVFRRSNFDQLWKPAMALLCLYIIILCSLSARAEVHLNYSEVQRFGKGCPQLESCEFQKSSRSRELISMKERNCACDYLCHEYGDCCIDAPGIEAKHSLTDFSCYELKQFGGVYMIGTCLTDYDGPDDVRYMCEDMMPNLSDPLGTMPATDSATGVTYRNYYCSICNYNTENIVLWTPRLECPTVTLLDSTKNVSFEYAFKNITYSETGWGLNLTGDNGSLFFHDCEVDPVMPALLESKIRLCKPELISDCPLDWEDDDVRVMCASYMGARFVHSYEKYRNVHCAICNGADTSHLSCKFAEMRDLDIFRTMKSNAFSLLLDINEGRGQEVGMVTICENGEVFDPFFKMCRSLACLPGYIRRGNECVPRGLPSEEPEFLPASGDGGLLPSDPELVEINSSNSNLHSKLKYRPVNDVSENDTDKFSDVAKKSHNSSNIKIFSPLQEEIAKLQNCLLISLTAEDYVVLPNNNIYVPKYNKTYEPTTYHSVDGSILVCSHLAYDADIKFLPIMGYVTTAGIVISMICLLLHLVVFSIVPDLQNLSGRNLASQCLSLLAAYTCFLVGSFDSISSGACTVISFLTFYFFQVSFFWMAAMAFDVWRTLKMATTELRVAKGTQFKRFFCYSFFTWITPLFVVTIAAMAEYTDLFPVEYRPGFASPQCWFKRRRALLVFFVVPLIIIMAANIFLFLSSARMLLVATQASLKQQNQSQKRSFKLYLRLALLMGLTWVTGLAASYADIEPLWYLFVILNTLQGLFIFVGFSCTSKVYNYFKEKSSKTAYKSTSHSVSTGSTNTSLSPRFPQKLSSKFFLRNKNSSSMHSSGSVSSTRKVTPLF